VTDGSEDDVEAQLRAVGPRLRALRRARRTTLAEVSGRTGISVSTLSRLESGGRRPTLKLLLLLARAYDVPLDQLAGTTPVRPGPPAGTFERRGATFVPLTRRPGGLRAFKQVVPVRPTDPSPRLNAHEGYAWMYVLSGQLRLLLGEHDLMLGPGEVAEFDCRTPHFFANPGPGPTEVLSIFGAQGERPQVRSRAVPRTR
jgi:transcriptional regulator with XRE-family HTH domain